MNYDVIVIGAGISGLTAAALLAKRGRRILLIEAQDKPGGSMGIFKRNGAVFEQGASMLYGFSEKGFNPHRYVFNVLEEPLTVIRHEHLYVIHFGDDDIIFYEDMERFCMELMRVFPEEEKGIKRFYHDMSRLYWDVIAETPLFVSPDVVPKEQAKEQFMKHPLSYLKFLTYMNQSMKKVLRSYFKGEHILQFFDKMTSTYCYATVEEAPAVLGAVMFVDNHYGGSYYPAGSTMQLTGKLEKVIEAYDGTIVYSSEVEKILTEEEKVKGIRTTKGHTYYAGQVIYSGNIWSLYEKLLNRPMKRHYEPTYASVVLYARIKKACVPVDALPIEMFITDKSKIDEDEITVYLFSLDDHTLCDAGEHVLVAVGPSFCNWGKKDKTGDQKNEYELQKQKETDRILTILERRYIGIKENLIFCDLGTPTTLERYILKYKGSVAGPKQMLGQHMLKRQHTKTEIAGLYCCGEGTVMGTGTPAVTVSGIAAANLALREAGCREYTKEDEKKNYVSVVKPPYTNHSNHPSMLCEYCHKPACEEACPVHIPIRDINRRLSVENRNGAGRIFEDYQRKYCAGCNQVICQKVCARGAFDSPVPIQSILQKLMEK